MSLPRYRPIRPCQRGAALLVSLVMLLLLTVIALAGVSDSTLQQRMAHNSRQLNKSFQAAESALRHLEQQLEAGLLTLPTDPCQPLCEVPVTVLNGAAGSAPGAEWNQLPVSGNEVEVWFHLVRLGDSSLLAGTAPGSDATLYRVTVMARQGSARTLLEAGYAQLHEIAEATTGAGVAPQAFQRVAWRQLH